MDAHQLVAANDEQSSGYRCSGSPAGVRKCARVHATERRLFALVSCVQALVHEQELVPDHGEDYDRIRAVGVVRLLRGQRAGVVCVREQTGSSACGGVQEHAWVQQGRQPACRECATMVAMQPEPPFARGERSNAWVDKIKEVGGAELHRGVAAGVVQGRGWTWSAGRRADRGDGARVREAEEAGEEDVEEEVDPGSNGRLRGQGRRGGRECCSPRKKKDGPSWSSKRGDRPTLGHGVGVKLGTLPGGGRRKRRVEWREEEV
uniref:Uncharacterized protein n=1 Tax=Aegilops tauschii subsp. strangulata TaxID=200361 RepID=A0A453BLV4_AEGTS